MRQGYSPLSVGNLLRVAAHVSRWLDDRGLAIDQFTARRVEKFAAHRRRQRYTQFLTPLLGYLREIGAAPPPPPPSNAAVEVFVRAYADYVASERGLARLRSVALRPSRSGSLSIAVLAAGWSGIASSL